MKKDIPVYIVLIICGIIMVYCGFTFYGNRGGYSALLSIGIIGYLIFKDYQDKKQAEKESKEAKTNTNNNATILFMTTPPLFA